MNENIDTIGCVNSERDPAFNICDREFKSSFIDFCSLVCILHNKKLNLANIFLFVLKESKGMDLYMQMCDFDNEFEALKNFLQYDTSLHKSKYIKKYLNSIEKQRAE